MKLSLPVSRVIFFAVDQRHRLEDVGLVVHPRQRGLELEQDERQPDLGDRRVVRDGDARIEGLA